MVNPQVKEAKLAYILNDCQARAIVTDGAGLGVLPGESRLATVVATEAEKGAPRSPPPLSSRAALPGCHAGLSIDPSGAIVH